MNQNVRVSKTLHKHFSKCIKDLKYFLKDLHFRSSQQRYCVRKSVLRNFAKFTGKRLCQRPATLLKKRLWYRCFPVNFAEFLGKTFLQNTSGRLLLELARNLYIEDNFEIIIASYSQRCLWNLQKEKLNKRIHNSPIQCQE